MTIHTTDFGVMPDQEPITRFTLTNMAGLSVAILDYGALLASVKLPTRDGQLVEVTLGFDTLAEYLADAWFCGATIGRYANRMKDGRFVLDGIAYQLEQNSFPSHLHGGRHGFHKVVWQAEPQIAQDSASVRLTRLSRDGEEGYPGNLAVTVTYTLNDRNELRLAYQAETDAPTPINLTNHAYWNLEGIGHGTALDHELTLYAEQYLPTDQDRIPTGDIATVRETVMDFTAPKRIGAQIEQVVGGGYNHCYVFPQPGGMLQPAARVVAPQSGRVLEIATTAPGMQFYSGHFLSNYRAAGGKIVNKYGAFCLEAQHFPNSVNQPEFPPTILRPGNRYTQTTIFRFEGG